MSVSGEDKFHLATCQVSFLHDALMQSSVSLSIKSRQKCGPVLCPFAGDVWPLATHPFREGQGTRRLCSPRVSDAAAHRLEVGVWVDCSGSKFSILRPGEEVRNTRLERESGVSE